MIPTSLLNVHEILHDHVDLMIVTFSNIFSSIAFSSNYLRSAHVQLSKVFQETIIEFEQIQRPKMKWKMFQFLYIIDIHKKYQVIQDVASIQWQKGNGELHQIFVPIFRTLYHVMYGKYRVEKRHPYTSYYSI